MKLKTLDFFIPVHTRCIFSTAAHAQTFSVIHAFNGVSGETPVAGVTLRGVFSMERRTAQPELRWCGCRISDKSYGLELAPHSDHLTLLGGWIWSRGQSTFRPR